MAIRLVYHFGVYLRRAIRSCSIFDGVVEPNHGPNHGRGHSWNGCVVWTSASTTIRRRELLYRTNFSYSFHFPDGIPRPCGYIKRIERAGQSNYHHHYHQQTVQDARVLVGCLTSFGGVRLLQFNWLGNNNLLQSW